MIRPPPNSPFFPYPPLFRSPYDLCILDGTALDRLADRIQDRKNYQQTVFLPFLLVTAEQQVGLVTRHLWKSIDEVRSEEHTSELLSRQYLVCRLLLEKKKKI